MLPQEQNLSRDACAIEGRSWTRWLHEIRRIEFVRTMRYVPLGPDSTVLELGCGEGFQLDLLRERFRRVFAVDPEAIPDSRTGFAKCVAEALPFPDRFFDLVVSSSVTEHLTDRQRAMEEVRRVLRPGGYAAHVVPTRLWKFTSLALNPLGYPLRVIEKWYARRRLRHDGIGTGRARLRELPTPGMPRVLGRWLFPPIHGTFSSHTAEYRSYGRQQWIRAFALQGFKFVAELPLLFYTPFGFCRFRLVPQRVWAAYHGFASTRAFIFQAVTSGPETDVLAANGALNLRQFSSTPDRPPAKRRLA
jgi:SAM-dependent methyltransferase